MSISGAHIRACVLGWTIPTIVWAGVEPVADATGDGFGELPVVLTASRLRQSVNQAPSSVTVIDREMIEKSGARHIADLMRFVPGAIVGYEDGNRPVVTLRGMAGVFVPGLQVLIDGVSVYSPIWGGMQWEELPIALSDIDRIEVIRGPNAALFGPNSFLGVINIITREPAADSGTRLEGNAGARGIADGTVRYASSDGGWRYRMTLGQRASSGFGARPDFQRYLFGNAKAEYRLDATDAVQLLARWADNKKDVGDYATNTVSNQYPHPITGHQANFQLRWTRSASVDDDMWIQYYHLQTATRDHVAIDVGRILGLPLPIPYLIDIDYLSFRDGLELQRSYRWSENLRSVSGLEARRDAVDSTRVLGTSAQRSSTLSRGFVNVEWKFADAWTLHSAAMVERNTLARTAWSPKVALTYEPVTGHVFRASASRAQRTPTISEKYGNYYFAVPALLQPLLGSRIYRRLSTGGVNSETVASQEVGYAFELPLLRLTGDMRAFHDRYRGLVGQRGLDIVNMDDATIKGGDFTLNWNPRQETRVRLALSGSHITSTDQGGLYSQSVPASTVALFCSQQLGTDVDVSINYQRVGSMFWTDAGVPKKPIPPIEYLNLRLARKVSYRDSAGELALVVQNALGNHTEYYVGAPRAVAVRAIFAQFSLGY